MATYLPNSNDYIPKSKSYTPDFKFLADVLGRRQDRYNTNFKQLNELYGKVVHADLSHEDNIHKRDEYANLLVPKIQQITGTDFSLQQNADAARALFKPFFEDKPLVRDIVYTKRFNSQMGLAESFKKSPLKKERERYWEDGVKRLNYSMQDFKEGSLEDIMTTQMPEYVEDPDLLLRAQEYLMNYEGDGKKYEVSDIVFSEDGKWMVHQTNGSLLTHRPTGVIDPDTKQMGMYNPAANLISTNVAGDPLIARGYATSAYVKAREFYENEDNIAKYGSEEGAERFWLQSMVDQTKVQTNEVIDEEIKQKKSATKTKNSWDAYLKTNPNQNTETQQDYINALAAITAIEEGIGNQKTILSDISRDGTDINELRNIAYQAFMHGNLSKDIYAAAAQYAESTRDVTKREINPIWEKELDYRYKAKLQNQKRIDDLADSKALIDYENAANQIGLELEGPGLQPIAPDAEINASSYANEDDKIGSNNSVIQGLVDKTTIDMLATVQKAYGDLGPSWSDEENQFNSAGMEVNVFVYDDGSGYMKDDNPKNKKGAWEKQILTWNETQEYFLGPNANQSDLEDAYNDVLKRYTEQEGNLQAPMFADLNRIISTNQTNIKNRKGTVIDMIDNSNIANNEAYRVVITKNPELGNWLKNNNATMFDMSDSDNPVMHTQEEFKKQVTDAFEKKAEALNLPGTLPTQDEYAAELLANDKTGVYTRRGSDVRTPMGASLAYHKYLNGLFPKSVTDQFGGVNYMKLVKYFYTAEATGGKKPGNVSQEVWDKSIEKTVRNNTYYFPKTNNNTRMVLSSNNDYSGLNQESEKAYDNIYNAMNEGMTSSNAGNGFPTYDARREYMLQDQTDDGSISMSDSQGGTYIHGQAAPAVAEQVQLAFNTLNRLDKSFTTVKAGKPETHGEGGILETPGIWDPGMDIVLQQLRIDLKPQEVQTGNTGNRPNFHIAWNDNINGKSGWVVQLDQKYVNKIRATNEDVNKLLAAENMIDNTFVIYVDKDQVNNPMSMENMYISSTKRTIKNNPSNQFYHEEPNGGTVKAWYGADDQVWIQASTMVYDFDTKEYVTTYSKATQAINANGQPMTDRQLDQFIKITQNRLVETADSNRIAKNKATK
tara:strand:- start:390 stop:3737 length:3348 start_codon:yes stop_codon:yes gene_type:complete